MGLNRAIGQSFFFLKKLKNKAAPVNFLMGAALFFL